MADVTTGDNPGAEPRTRKVVVSGLEFNVLDEGRGDPVLLLHGFPSSHRLWRHQVKPLVDAGFRVIAPDLRGFGDSARPQHVDDYRFTRLLGDVVGILNSLQVRRTHVVAHDFGAFIGWSMAALLPPRVDHLVTISVGHPATFSDVSIEQRRNAWYSLLFQFPEAEQILRQRNWKLLRQLFDGDRDAAQFLADLTRPGALTAGLNWYRANRAPAMELAVPAMPAVVAPTMGIWGAQDRALTEDSMFESGRWVRGPWRYERVEEAGHYVPVDAPDRLNALLLDFLGAHRAEVEARQLASPGGRRRIR